MRLVIAAVDSLIDSRAVAIALNVATVVGGAPRLAPLRSRLGGAACSALPNFTQNDLFGAHGREEVPDRQGEPLADQGVQDAIGVASLRNKARLAEHAQVPRDRWSGGVEPRGYRAGG
jgi:hypothetical protein